MNDDLHCMLTIEQYNNAQIHLGLLPTESLTRNVVPSTPRRPLKRDLRNRKPREHRLRVEANKQHHNRDGQLRIESNPSESV